MSDFSIETSLLDNLVADEGLYQSMILSFLLESSFLIAKGAQESRGCYGNPEVNGVYVRLYSSMTPQLCADRSVKVLGSKYTDLFCMTDAS